MKSQEIQKYIDRVVGTEGILRIPSWWMHKILSDLLQYCDSLESSGAGIKEYLESQLNLVGDAIEALDARVSEVESHELFAIVSELPSEPKENTIYLVPSANGEGNNILTEWVYINDAWEQFGEFKADVDLSEYVKKAENPFEKGDVENSAVLKGLNNHAVSEGSVAFGKNNVAGLRGWYYGSINKIDDTTIDVYISDSQMGFPNFPTWGGTTKLSNLDPYSILGNKVVSLINGKKYDYNFKAIGGEAGRIRLQTLKGNLPFSSIANDTTLNPEDFSIYCLSNSTAGAVDLSLFSTAEGYFSRASGNYSHAEGWGAKAAGTSSHAEGENTNAIGYCSHAEGYFTEAGGNGSHAEGLETIIHETAAYAHTEGWCTVATNEAEHAEGRLNKSNPGTIHSVGIGTDVYNLKNAHEIMETGEHYVFNVGGYDGTNPTKSKDLATVLNEANTKITELSVENERLKERIEEQDQFIEDLQNMKIDKENDDYYPKMAVGLADNLAGVDVVDSEINFRRSGGGAISDGVARIESIKGNSVVWNQVVKPSTSSKEANGVHIISQGDGSFKVYTDDAGATAETTQSSTDIYLLPTHKYAVFGCPQGGGSTSYYVWWTGFGMADHGSGLMQTYSGSGAVSYWSLVIKAGVIIPQSSPLIFRPRAIDLTKMFGAGNEPTTIDEFYARIPMGVDMNAYNEGEVIHMDVQSVESQSVNAWDEEWESGSISVNTGANVDRSGVIRTKNFIPVIEGRKYYYSCPATGTAWSFCYDDNYNIVEKYLSNNKTGLASTLYKAEFTIPQGVHYIKFYVVDTYGATYNHDICINLSDTSINGKYFPHIKRVEDLSLIRKYFPDGMKSAGTAHDEIRYNKASGKWEKVVRIGEVKMKDLSWTASSSAIAGVYRMFTTLQSASYPDAGKIANILTNKYVASLYNDVYNAVSDKLISLASTNTTIQILDKSHTNAATFKASLTDDDILYYELAEPIVTELDAEDQFRDLDYQVWNGGTEKANAEGKSAPLAAEISYGFNAIGKIKELEEAIKALQTTVASM